MEFADRQTISCPNRSRTSQWRWVNDDDHHMTWMPQADTCEARRDLDGPGWTRMPALAELTDLPSGTASGAGSLIGRWQVPLDPLVHLVADATFAVSLPPSGNDPVMHGAWQPPGGAQAGV